MRGRGRGPFRRGLDLFRFRLREFRQAPQEPVAPLPRLLELLLRAGEALEIIERETQLATDKELNAGPVEAGVTRAGGSLSLPRVHQRLRGRIVPGVHIVSRSGSKASPLIQLHGVTVSLDVINPKVLLGEMIAAMNHETCRRSRPGARSCVDDPKVGHREAEVLLSCHFALGDGASFPSCCIGIRMSDHYNALFVPALLPRVAIDSLLSFPLG